MKLKVEPADTRNFSDTRDYFGEKKPTEDLSNQNGKLQASVRTKWLLLRWIISDQENVISSLQMLLIWDIPTIGTDL